MLKNKEKLYLIYHDKNQVNRNCFVSQILEILKKNFNIDMVSLLQIREGDYIRPVKGDLVLSVLKQRSYRSVIPFLASYLRNTSLIIYDQDPWEAYHDNASSPGLYPLLNDLLPISRFLVTSGWWSKLISEKDQLPVRFVRMGVLDRNCSLGPKFSSRRYPLGFQGTLHRHRADFFKFLEENGWHVECLPPVSYNHFLRSIQRLGVFVHDEYADVFLDGIASLNGIWIKDIEVAARGCISIRNVDLDKDFYDIDELPAIFTYSNREESLLVLEKIFSMSNKEKDNIRNETVSRIRERNDWMTIVHEILCCK